MRSLLSADAYAVTSTDWCPGCEDYTPGSSGIIDGIVYRRCDECGGEDAYDVREVGL